MPNIVDTRHTVMPWRAHFFRKLFHSGMVFLLRWSISRLLRSLGSKHSRIFFLVFFFFLFCFCFFFLFCFCFFLFCFCFFSSKFTLPGVMIACDHVSSKRKKHKYWLYATLHLCLFWPVAYTQCWAANCSVAVIFVWWDEYRSTQSGSTRPLYSIRSSQPVLRECLVLSFLYYSTVYCFCREMRSPGGSCFPLCNLLQNSVTSGVILEL